MFITLLTICIHHCPVPSIYLNFVYFPNFGRLFSLVILQRFIFKNIYFIFLQDKRKDIENFVGVKLKSMLCVPVSSRNNEGLIALACVVNKKDAEKWVVQVNLYSIVNAKVLESQLIGWCCYIMRNFKKKKKEKKAMCTRFMKTIRKKIVKVQSFKEEANWH